MIRNNFKKLKGEGKIKSSVCYLLVIALLNVLFISFASAADPGHGAGSIGAGTFEAGNYVFPNNFFMEVYK